MAFPFGDNWYYYNLKEEFRFNILKYAGVRQPCKMQVPMVNLGVHTPFELLNGSGNITDWVRKAKYQGIRHWVYVTGIQWRLRSICKKNARHRV
ncbi:hypothetical protein SFC43_13020 [Bacteroides sp. CR5/BHMF/2]|nr:hypothetical protein [Bacteroides sp. CR5/BHMF/2]